MGSKERIERVAADLLARDGYNGMGLKAISDGASLPYGSIYHHFPSGKEGIAVAAITSMGSYTGALLAELSADGVTDAGIHAMFGFMADRLERSGWTKGCTVGTPALDGGAGSEPVRDSCDAVFSSLVETLAGALERQGVSRPDADDLATTIIAAYEGATMLARTRRSRVPLDVTAAAMCRLLRETLAA
ncbi:MAG: yxaF 1 [Ilumatobacteraceae bacterium]|nr:yxaF 1 [Ilumatobacteraceae bacterium]